MDIENNPLPCHKALNLSKFKAFLDDKFSASQIRNQFLTGKNPY